MKMINFAADADLVGRRIKVSWAFVPEAGETPADAPPVQVRRKMRDFEFPPPPPGESDPFLLYDSNTFPPPGATVSELPGWEVRENGTRAVTTVESAARLFDGRSIEVLRRTTTTHLDVSGNPVWRAFEILDVGDGLGGLTPGTVYYYELFGAGLDPAIPSDQRRAVATAGENHGLSRTLYEELPAIYRRHDTTIRPVTPNAEAVPEAAARSGQLRRFVDLFGTSLDLMRSSAEGLRGLHDIDTADHRYLPLLAAWIGWDLSFHAPIPLQRHEIKYAPALYRLTGTLPGTLIWVKRLTGWNAQVHEFYRNVFFSNHLGDPTDPNDRGSRTVDTRDAALVAAIGKPNDEVDYTYDTGTSDDDWYAYNVVGLFVRPFDDESADEITRKRDKLKRNLSLFLPVNVRGVVIIDVDAASAVQEETLALL